MKNFVILVLLALAALGAEATPPRMALDSTYIDMGRIERDSIGETTMRFRNTGGEDLIILKVFSDCGCTVASYTSESVKPGDGGEIGIRFNSKGRLPGVFRKQIRIRSNADNPREILIVKGLIE